MRVVMSEDTGASRVRFDPHFAFLLMDHSFTWDGHVTCPIQVEYVGSGRRVAGTIHLDEGDLPDERIGTPYGWIEWFEGICGCALRDMPFEQVF